MLSIYENYDLPMVSEKGKKKAILNHPMLISLLINLESRCIIIFRGICLFYLCILKRGKDSKEIREKKHDEECRRL